MRGKNTTHRPRHLLSARRDSGLSENITVCSIVGNFLEHSRIFYFENDGEPQIFMGSADWMPRNLDRRVEILFPVEDEKLKARICHILEVQLADNVKAQYLRPDGTYAKRKPPRQRAGLRAGYLLCGGSAGGEGSWKKSRIRRR